MTSKELTDNKYVHDAHVTGEVWALTPVKMCLYQKINIANPNDRKTLMYHPFGDTKNPARSLGPVSADINVVETMLPPRGSQGW